MIFGVYLFVPIIGKWVRGSSTKEHLYFLGIWALTIILSQPVLEALKPDIELSYFSGFLGYLVLGYFLDQRNFENKRLQRKIALSLIGVGLISTILGTYLIHYYTGKYESTFYECLSPNILLYSSGVFLFVKNRTISFSPLVKVRDFISKYSYGVFLVHVLVFFKLQDFGITWNFVDPVIGIPLTVTICFAISLFIVFIINKLPFGKYISG
jgi:surface polysaccharide O-acyltransferase-like enzyme